MKNVNENCYDNEGIFQQKKRLVDDFFCSSFVKLKSRETTNLITEQIQGRENTHSVARRSKCIRMY